MIFNTLADITDPSQGPAVFSVIRALDVLVHRTAVRGTGLSGGAQVCLEGNRFVAKKPAFMDRFRMSNCDLVGQQRGAGASATGIEVRGTAHNVSVNSGNIVGHEMAGGFGIDNVVNDAAVDAKQNWWGAPGGPGAAPEADRVNGMVDAGAPNGAPVSQFQGVVVVFP